MRDSASLQWLPPTILGAALASATLIAAGLLLYGGPGLMRALTVVLATLLVSLGFGLAVGRREGRGDPVEGLRRWWLFLLVTFTTAAFFSAMWEGFRGFGAGALSQAAGLAVLGALPLFAGGGVLGSSSRLPVDRDVGGAALAVFVLAGAATGVLLMGFLLFARLSPAAILLVCVVGLSGAALVQGQVLDRMVMVRPLFSGEAEAKQDRPKREGVWVEAWVRDGDEGSSVAIVEGGRLRCLIGNDGGPVFPLDRFLVEGLETWGGGGGKVMVMGVGGAHLAWRCCQGRDGMRPESVVLADADGTILDAILAHVGPPGEPEEDEGTPLELRKASVGEMLGGRSGGGLSPSTFDMIFLDTLALAPHPEDFAFPSGSLVRLRESLRPGGVLVVAPLHEGEGDGALLELARGVATIFPRVSVYVGSQMREEPVGNVPPGRRALWWRTQPRGGARPGVLLASGDDGVGWPDRLAGFLRVRIRG